MKAKFTYMCKKIWCTFTTKTYISYLTPNVKLNYERKILIIFRYKRFKDNVYIPKMLISHQKTHTSNVSQISSKPIPWCSSTSSVLLKAGIHPTYNVSLWWNHQPPKAMSGIHLSPRQRPHTWLYNFTFFL